MPAPWRRASAGRVSGYASPVGFVGWAVIGVGVIAIVAVTVYLIRQRRYYAPPPADLRRAGDETSDYSEYEHGHDIATGFVERGGGF